MQCSLRHFEKRCLPHKIADAPSAGQSHSGKPFNVKCDRKIHKLSVLEGKEEEDKGKMCDYIQDCFNELE